MKLKYYIKKMYINILIIKTIGELSIILYIKSYRTNNNSKMLFNSIYAIENGHI